MFLKRKFPVKNGKIALVLASMVVTYYAKPFRTGADRHNGILMSLLLLVVETIMFTLFNTPLLDELAFQTVISLFWQYQKLHFFKANEKKLFTGITNNLTFQNLRMS